MLNPFASRNRLQIGPRCRGSAAIVLIALSAGCGPWRNDTVRATLSFVDADRAGQITDISLIVGGDRVSWANLAAGESKSATLLPGPQDDRQLTLLYTRGDARKSWEGPKFPAGTGYRIAVRIAADGSVTARHCALPCELD